MITVWATAEDAVTLTGTPVAEDDVVRAQAAVELAVGRTEAEASAEITPRDLEWLRRAVAYQAVWMTRQPDLFRRLEVRQLAQDGMSATFTGSALVLAPWTRRALAKLSRRGDIHSVTVEPHVAEHFRRWSA